MQTPQAVTPNGRYSGNGPSGWLMETSHTGLSKLCIQKKRVDIGIANLGVNFLRERASGT